MSSWWSGLSSRKRTLIVAAGVAETALKVAVLVDLRRRPASQVRGSRRLWAASMAVNSAGLLPLLYFVIGRRKEEAAG